MLLPQMLLLKECTAADAAADAAVNVDADADAADLNNVAFAM